MTSKDYINEGYELITDTFESVDSFDFKHTDLSSYSEADMTKNEALDIITSKIKKSDGAVIGVLEGVFFMPDGYSRNRRFYSEKLWKKCLESDEIKVKLNNGMMLGTLDHPSVWENEIDGVASTAHIKYSGIVTKSLKIVEANGKKYGVGKAYILNTPIGNTINVLLKAKDEDNKPLIKLAVSSRALAKAKGKDKSGNTILDENSYILNCFDVVLNPGIPEAFPEYKAVESVLDNIYSNQLSELDTPVSFEKIEESSRMRDLVRLKLGLK